MTQKANKRFKKIVFGADFSESSVEAFKLALQMSDKDTEIDIVHIAPHETNRGIVTPHLDEALADKAMKDYHAETMQLLDEKYISTCKTDAKLTVVVLVGTPNEEILKHAIDVNSDLIVMGMNGKLGIGRMLLGRVVEKLIRASHIPVLVVPRHE